MPSISLLSTSGNQCSPASRSDSFPSVGLYDVNRALANLPEEGEITFRFRRDQATVSKDQKLDLRLSLIEVVKFKAVEVDEDEPSKDDLLDELFKEAQASEAEASKDSE